MATWANGGYGSVFGNGVFIAGGLVAMVAVLLAIKQRDGTAIIQSLLLMLWQIGLPLLAMAKLAQLNH